jgi:hypothetical protein
MTPATRPLICVPAGALVAAGFGVLLKSQDLAAA